MSEFWSVKKEEAPIPREKRRSSFKWVYIESQFLSFISLWRDKWESRTPRGLKPTPAEIRVAWFPILSGDQFYKSKINVFYLIFFNSFFLLSHLVVPQSFLLPCILQHSATRGCVHHAAPDLTASVMTTVISSSTWSSYKVLWAVFFLSKVFT